MFARRNIHDFQSFLRNKYRHCALEQLESRQFLSADFVSAFSLGGPLNQNAFAVAVDAAGDRFVAGSFAGTTDFDPDPNAEVTYTSASYVDSSGVTQYRVNAYVAKYSTAGALLWTRVFGASDSSIDHSARKVAVDSSGDVWFVGSSSGPVDLGNGFAIDVSAALGFLGKLDCRTGQTLAIRTFDGGTIQEVYIDSADAMFAGGRIGGYNAFVAKYDTGGTLNWSRQFNGSDTYVTQISTDAAGNVIVSGGFWFRTDFNPGPATYSLASGKGALFSQYVVKLDVAGNFVWATNFENTTRNSLQSPAGAAVDSAGNVYVTGYFHGEVDFLTGKSQFKLATGVGYAIYLAKVNANGSFAWAKGTAGGNSERPTSVLIGSDGALYLSGSFADTVDIDLGPAIANLTASSPVNGFLARYNVNGDYHWAAALNGGGSNIGNWVSDVTLHENGSLIAVGTFSATVDFDPGPANSTLTSSGVRDAFVLTLQDSGPSSDVVALQSATRHVTASQYLLIAAVDQVLADSASTWSRKSKMKLHA